MGQEDGMKGFWTGLLAGALLLGGLRLVAAPLHRATHHHANWSVVVEGERLDLSGDAFMEEVSACRASDDGILPEQRVHMHEGVDHVVHVHHEGSTWGHLMLNLGMSLGPDHLFLADGRRYVVGDSTELAFVLNGLAVPDVHNRVVGSGDRLLIAVGPEAGRRAMAWFDEVADDAEAYNERQDPASCAGHGELPFLERLRLAFWG